MLLRCGANEGWAEDSYTVARATACIYLAFSIPIRMAFYQDFRVGFDDLPGYVVLDLLSTLLFSVDTVRLLRGKTRGVVAPSREDDCGSQRSVSSDFAKERIVAERSNGHMRCSFAFIFSLVATIPFEYFDLLISGGQAATPFMINRLLRLTYLPFYLSDISMILERKGVMQNIGLHRAWKLFFAMAIAGHWCGCGFFYTARVQTLKGNPSTWPQDIGLYRAHQTAELDSYYVEMLKSTPEAYIQSLYWAYITMITTGFGDIVPLSIPETVWCIFSMYVGVLITTCAIANLQLLVTNMDAALTQFQQKLELTKKYTRYRRLPSNLTNRIISFYEYSWDLLKGADEEKFLSELPGSLQQQVANFMYRDLISSLPVLRKANNALLNALADCAEINIFSPHDDILKPGETVRGAVLVSRGELVVLNGKTIERKMQQFDRFAEESLFVPKTSDRLIRANTFCEVFLLPAGAFQEIINAQCDKAHIAQMKETAMTLAKNSIKANKMFGSGVDVVPMRGFNKHCHPDSRFRKVWDCVILVGLVYYIIAIPLSIMKSVRSYTFVENAALLIVGYAIDLLFIIDLILNFNFFMYSQEGLVVFDRERIRQKFLSQHGVLRHIMCALPIDFLTLAPFGARYANVYRLTKMARIPKLVSYIARTEKLLAELKVGIDQSLGRVLKLNFLMIVVCHWVGCLWYTCADVSDWIGLGDNWKDADELDDSLSIDHSDFGGFTAYLRSVYWAIVGMSTVGYGDIIPTNILETSFALTCVLFGGLVLPAVVGGLAAYMGNFNMAAKIHRKKLAKIRRYMRKTRLQPSLVDKVQHYYDYLFSRQGGVDEEATVDELPDPLRQKVALHVNGTSIDAVPFFSLCDEPLKQLIVSVLRPRVFLPGDIITQQGEVGTEMFLIERGQVVVTTEDGKIPFCTLTNGDYFGESCLLGATVRIAAVKALTYCDCFVLSKDDFNSAMSTCNAARRKSISSSVADTIYRKSRQNTCVKRNIAEFPKVHKFAAPNDIQVGIDNLADTAKFHPDSAFRRIWNVALLVVLLYNAWSIPFRLAFESSVSSFVVDWALDAVLFVDMHLCYCKFSFVQEGELITDKEKVKQRYISGQFRLDVLSTFPLDLIAFLSLIEFPSLGFILALLRVPRLLRLTRLLSLLSDIFRAIEDTSLSQAKMQLIEFLSGVILIAHWAACGFFAIARWRNSAAACAELDTSNTVVTWANQFTECRWTGTWIQRQIINGKVPITGGSIWQLYLRSFNWALPTLVVVVIGDVVPVNSAETLYAFLWMVVGVTINAAIIGNVANIVANLDSDLADFVERADQIKSFLHRHQVRYEIQDRVVHFMNYIWATHDGMANEDGFVKELPLTLQLAVTETTRMSLIRDCPFFDFCSDDIIKAVALCLKPLVFSVGDILAHEGDMGQEMFFLEKGSVEVLSGDGKTVFATLSDKGCFFGETSLFFKTKRQNTLRAATFCEVFQLDKCDLDEELRQRDFDLSRMLGVFTDIADSNRRRNTAVKENLEASKLPHTKLHKILGTDEANGAATKVRRAFLPNSTFRAAWDIVSMLFTAHYSTSIPFHVAFTLDSAVENSLNWLVLDVFIDIFFLIDMVLRCRHFAFIRNGTTITEKEEIKRHYCRHGLILDAVSCLPLETLSFLLGFEKIFLFRLIHLLRVRRLTDYLKRIEGYLTLWNVRISAAATLLLKMFFFYVLVNHWCGCIWFAIHRYIERHIKYTWATTDCAGEHCLAEWNQASGKHNICSGPISDCYIRSVHFVITTISTVGYGDIAPVTELETIWQNVVVLVGACFFAGIIGAFTAYLSHNDTSGTNAFKLKVNKLQEYMRYRNLPIQLQSEIHTFHRHKWEQSHIMDERSIMSILPLPLKMDLSYEVLKHIIYQVPILGSLTKKVQKRIAHALSLQVCPPHSAVYRVGDIGWDIFFIGKGLCKVKLPADLSDLDAAGKADVERLRQKADSVGLLYRIGNHFGESCLNSISGVRQETITAKTSAELYSISKDELEHIWSYMAPRDREKFRRDLLMRNGNTWHRFDDDDKEEEDGNSGMRPSLPNTSLRARQATFLSWTKPQRSSTISPHARRTQTAKRGSSLFDHDVRRLRSFSAQASKDAMHHQHIIRKVQSSIAMGPSQSALSRSHSAAVEIQRLVLSGEFQSRQAAGTSPESNSNCSSSESSVCASLGGSEKDGPRYQSRRIWDPGPPHG